MIIPKFLRPLAFGALACALAVSALGIAPSVARAEEKVLTVVADEWPPFSGENLIGKGMSPDIIVHVLGRAGYQAKVSIVPWARIMHGVRGGEADFHVIGSLFYDPELEGSIAYSDPYVETDVKFVRRIGTDADFEDLASLRPYSIAVGDGFLYEEKFDKADFLQKVVVTTALQGVQLVESGRVDLTLDSTDVIDFAIRVQDPSLMGKVEYLEKELATQEIHMAVMNSVPNGDQIIQDFNRALQAMRQDGSLDKLLAKHRGK